MKKEEFLDLVGTYFGSLKEKYGFSLIYSSGPWGFGDFNAIFESGNCRIQIETERGDMVISAGSLHAPFNYEYPGQWVDDPLTKWYNVWYVIAFVSHNKINWVYPQDTMPEDDRKTSVEKQMVKLSKLLEPSWSEVINFFRKDYLIERQKELDEFIGKINAEKGYGAPYHG
jgi:hypothetical protein